MPGRIKKFQLFGTNSDAGAIIHSFRRQKLRGSRVECQDIHFRAPETSYITHISSTMSLKEVEKRRTVFKPLLDNPYPQASFPMLPQETQKQITEFLMLQLQDITSWKSIGGPKPPQPEIMGCITTGFNSTVKVLESQAKQPQLEKKMRYVFVCKAEIKPQLLIQHFPVLCYTASQGVKVKLIQLPRCSMAQLEEKLGKKCAILGMYENGVISKSFRELLDSVPDVEVPWLDNVDFHKLNVKMVETTAPIKKNNNNQKKK